MVLETFVCVILNCIGASLIFYRIRYVPILNPCTKLFLVTRSRKDFSETEHCLLVRFGCSQVLQSATLGKMVHTHHWKKLINVQFIVCIWGKEWFLSWYFCNNLFVFHIQSSHCGWNYIFFFSFSSKVVYTCLALFLLIPRCVKFIYALFLNFRLFWAMLTPFFMLIRTHYFLVL
jgi:hypothetical protein